MNLNEKNDIIAGRNAVIEAIKSGSSIDTLYLLEGETGGSMNKIKAMARENSLLVKMTSLKKLDELSDGITHQGVVALTPCAEYKTVEDILAVSKSKGTDPFIIIADEIEDPHNLGALIRTAEAAGADGLIIPKRRSASLTATVHKTSAGAVSHLPVARVSNLTSCINDLKKQNIWIYGADTDGKNWSELDYKGGVCLIIGSEGNGIGALVKKQCDFIATLPMCGVLNSLNASVAGGILMYEVRRQRGNK